MTWSCDALSVSCDYRVTCHAVGGEEVHVSMPLSFGLIGELAHFCIEYMYELHDFYWEVRMNSRNIVWTGTVTIYSRKATCYIIIFATFYSSGSTKRPF